MLHARFWARTTVHEHQWRSPTGMSQFNSFSVLFIVNLIIYCLIMLICCMRWRKVHVSCIAMKYDISVNQYYWLQSNHDIRLSFDWAQRSGFIKKRLRFIWAVKSNIHCNSAGWQRDELESSWEVYRALWIRHWAVSSFSSLQRALHSHMFLSSPSFTLSLYFSVRAGFNAAVWIFNKTACISEQCPQVQPERV